MDLNAKPIGYPVNYKEKSPKLSKQLKSYYNNREKRIQYQKEYDTKHKEAKKAYDKQRYQTRKVKSVEKTVSVVCNLIFNLPYNSENVSSKVYPLLYDHKHGRQPFSKKCKHSLRNKRRLAFHFIPHCEICVSDLGSYFELEDGSKNFKMPNDYQVGLINECMVPKSWTRINGKSFTFLLAHFLGFQLGDSLVWKEKNLRGRTVTHQLNFDRSGLDISHPCDLERLVRHCVETGRKGDSLLHSFALIHSPMHYFIVYRGNKLLATNVTENATRQYVKDFGMIVS